MCSSNQVSRHPRRFCNSVQEDTFNDADSHLSQHHACEKLRLDLRGLSENGLEEAQLPVSRSRTGCLGDPLQRVIDVAYHQRMFGESALSKILAGFGDCRIADFQDSGI